MDKHYEKPEWLKGTAWEILSEEYGGKYSLFLEAAELSGYRPILDGKSLVTVMAPDNDAFSAYMQENGYSAVKDMQTDELKKLIGYHLVYYSYSKTDLENFRPQDNALGTDDEDDLTSLQPGMYYKFRTHSTSPVTKEVDPATNKAVTVYHLERFLPVFSHNIFKSKGIDAKKNYEYFYPGATWGGDAGFNVSNASVKEYQIIANNGYIYNIDKVLEPLETIYDIMKKKNEYSDFLDFYTQYSSYTYDKDLSVDYGASVGTDSLFLHRHDVNGLPNIALEWPVTNPRLYATLASTAYSVFAPSNQALNTFFNKYWKTKGYSSLSNLDPLIVRVLLIQSVYGGSIVFPDEVNTITNELGGGYDFDPYTVKDKNICVNGSFYGLSELKMPSMFQTVMGPSFLDKDYLLSLYALYNAGLVTTYGSNAAQYTMLITDNNSYETSDMRLIPDDNKNNMLATTGDDGDVAVTTAVARRMVNGHTVSQLVDIESKDWAIYPTQESSTYWFVRNGKLTTNYAFNNILGQDPSTLSDYFLEVKEIKNDAGNNWSNGKVYAYESSSFGVFNFELGSDFKTLLTTTGETRYPFFVFAQLLRKAKVFVPYNDGYAWNVNLSGPRIVAFIPSNEVLKEALESGKIPGIEGGSVDLTQDSPTVEGTVTNMRELGEYLMNYIFSSAYTPAVASVPYPGSPDWVTGEYRNSNNILMEYKSTGSSLSIGLKGGNQCNVVSTYENFPFTFSDGAFHIIDAVFN
ncbi:fasciclin [Bacteroides sp. 224]|nr:fasciclin [Bacteroides sp. 224]